MVVVVVKKKTKRMVINNDVELGMEFVLLGYGVSWGWSCCKRV